MTTAELDYIHPIACSLVEDGWLVDMVQDTDPSTEIPFITTVINTNGIRHIIISDDIIATFDYLKATLLTK